MTCGALDDSVRLYDGDLNLTTNQEVQLAAADHLAHAPPPRGRASTSAPHHRRTSSPGAHGRLVCGLLALTLTVAGCGGDGEQPAGTPVATGPSTSATTLPPSPTSLPDPVTSAPTTTSTGAALAVLAGEYVGSTGGSGEVTIGADGTARFEAPDLTACPSCSTASAPRATIDFKVTTVDPGGAAGSYRATGVITAESNPADVVARRAGPVGSVVQLVLVAGRRLTLGFLPTNDVLTKI